MGRADKQAVPVEALLPIFHSHEKAVMKVLGSEHPRIAARNFIELDEDYLPVLALQSAKPPVPHALLNYLVLYIKLSWDNI